MLGDRWTVLLLLASMAAAAAGQDGAPDLMQVELAPTIKRLLAEPDAPPRLFIFHGQWDSVEKPTPAEEAQIALLRYDLQSPALSRPETPVEIRAEAALLRGEPELTLSLLEDAKALPLIVMKAKASMDLARFAEAEALLEPIRKNMPESPPATAADAVAAGEAMVLLAHLQGRPAQDYHQALDLFGVARTDFDRLYWPAHLAEARLLMGKDSNMQALAAVSAALSLNPRSSEAWYRLGLLAVESFQFDKTAKCVEELRAIHPDHVLASLLLTQSSLAQKDAAAAREAIAPLLKQYPGHRLGASLAVATAAMSYDAPGVEAALARFDKLAPGSAEAHSVAGKYLSLARQYVEGRALLERAIKLQPNWAEPRVELGLLLMQLGDEPAARLVLRDAARLDPFNIRAANQLKLVEALLEYAQIETEHFIVKYKAGIDEVLARDMPSELESTYREVTAVFEHRPARKTLIELLPDEQHFAVRITGVPEIWTIAASTGDVIALTPPRLGARQRGMFDWARVVRHEFVHTVTLDQTANRIPHWFTEACAVSMEPGDRDFATCKLLAQSLEAGELFDLIEINWAFVRPRRPQDRALAYAQAHWMLQYITETWGHSAIVRMLRQFKTGATTQQAIAEQTGKTPEAFMDGFLIWGGEQIHTWGLDTPSARQVKTLRAEAESALAGNDAAAARKAVLRYAAACPVDTWPHEQLVRLAAITGRVDEALASLEHMDRQEQSSGQWASQLADAYVQMKSFDAAYSAAQRALAREPYNGTYREQAARIALLNGNTDAALHHLTGMTLLEPDRATHFIRLAALLSRLDRKDEAHAAAEKARKLDPKAPVDAFLR